LAETAHAASLTAVEVLAPFVHCKASPLKFPFIKKIHEQET